MNRTDYALITKIANRATEVAEKHAVVYSTLSAMMDIEAVHSVTPLRLADLLAADDGNFAHDVFGIRRYLDRKANPPALTECFVPRFTA